MNISEKECLDIFLQLEDENNYFEKLKVKNIYYWHYIRFLVFSIVQEILFNQINLNLQERKRASNKTVQDWLRTLEIYRKKEVLVFNSPRRVKEGNYYKDIYTDEWLKDFDKPYYVLEREYEGMHFRPVKTKNLRYINNDKKEWYVEKKTRGEKQNLSKSQVLDVVKDIEEKYGIIFSNKQKKRIISNSAWCIGSRNGYYMYYRKILNSISPKVIVCVCSYGYDNLILCEVAKDMGIPVVELEHGIIGQGHISYNFYRKRKIKSFPDYIFVFGDYDKIVPRYPIDRKKIYVVGSPELNKKKEFYQKKLDNISKKKKIITYLSCNDFKLIEDACELSQRIDSEKYIVRVKLHPSEYTIWKRIYPFLVKTNIQVVDDSKHDIYYYLATSDYVVGGVSTTMFEATVFDTQIRILKEGEYFRLEPIVKYGRGKYIDSFKDILEELYQQKENQFQDWNNPFFINDSKKVLISTLKKIANGRF